MKKLDLYIIRKFLGTFFFSLVLILWCVARFDETAPLYLSLYTSDAADE